jgi:hypothetical protein
MRSFMIPFWIRTVLFVNTSMTRYGPSLSPSSLRYMPSFKTYVMMFSLVVVGASPIGGIGYPNGKGL